MTIKKGIYRHFKGHIYKVTGTAKHSETLEDIVVYVNIENENDLWVRPVKMFSENVDRNGKSYPRFEFIKECD